MLRDSLPALGTLLAITIFRQVDGFRCISRTFLTSSIQLGKVVSVRWLQSRSQEACLTFAHATKAFAKIIHRLSMFASPSHSLVKKSIAHTSFIQSCTYYPCTYLGRFHGERCTSVPPDAIQAAPGEKMAGCRALSTVHMFFDGLELPQHATLLCRNPCACHTKSIEKHAEFQKVVRDFGALTILTSKPLSRHSGLQILRGLNS